MTIKESYLSTDVPVSMLLHKVYIRRRIKGCNSGKTVLLLKAKQLYCQALYLGRTILMYDPMIHFR